MTKVDSSGTIKYLYDQSKVAIERDVSNNNLATNTHEGGSLYQDLISMRRGGNTYYHLFDGLGSVVQMVDASENTQNSYTYEAFGRIMSQTQNVPNRYKFVGAYDVYYDATPALYFMQARYYDPWRGGRFITMDPLRGAPQDPLSFHRYLYVTNNPVNYRDPTGASRYDLCEGWTGFAYWLCKRIVDWACNKGMVFCCRAELSNCRKDCEEKYCGDITDPRIDGCYAICYGKWLACIGKGGAR